MIEVAGLLAAGRRVVRVAAIVAGATSVSPAQTTVTLSVRSSFGFHLGTAQVTSSPAGIDCRSESSGYVSNGGTCTAEFPAGSSVSLTVTPLYDGTFDGWTGACAGQGATCQLVMTAAAETSPRTIAKTYTLTVLGTGNSTGFLYSVDWFSRPKLSCEIGPGGVTRGTCTTEVPAQQWAWIGRDDGTPYGRFAGFSPACDPAPGDCMLFMNRPRTVTTGWTAEEIIIAPLPGSSGTGTVTGAAPNHMIGSFDCTVTPTGAAGVCSAKWDYFMPPMSVTLTATPAGNSTFLGWGGGCTSAVENVCVIELQYRTVEIRPLFETSRFALSIAAPGSGDGKVVSAPVGIDCTITGGVGNQGCSMVFPNGTEVTLTADPLGGSTFAGWNGACSGTSLTCVVTITARTEAVARFVAPRPAAELALALLGRLTLSADERRELDRFGNRDAAFNLGDLLALLARTGERLPASTLSALVAAHRDAAVQPGDRRIP